MSNIVKYLLSDIVGGTPTPTDSIASTDAAVGSTLGEGLVHDNDGNIYQPAAAGASSAIRRLSETPLSIDLEVLPDAFPDNFLNPTFATIVVTSSPPTTTLPNSFGDIIW